MKIERTHYRLSEIAQMTGLSKSFLRSCVSNGILHADRFKHSPKVWLVSVGELEAFRARNLEPVPRGENDESKTD